MTREDKQIVELNFLIHTFIAKIEVTLNDVQFAAYKAQLKESLIADGKSENTVNCLLNFIDRCYHEDN